MKTNESLLQNIQPAITHQSSNYFHPCTFKQSHYQCTSLWLHDWFNILNLCQSNDLRVVSRSCWVGLIYRKTKAGCWTIFIDGALKDRETPPSAALKWTTHWTTEIHPFKTESCEDNATTARENISLHFIKKSALNRVFSVWIRYLLKYCGCVAVLHFVFFYYTIRTRSFTPHR